jgi:DNA polymerase III sliding clamp (beta) subunit (PCNA family)
MKVVVERSRFFKMLKITAEKRSRRQWLYDTSFIRIQAQGDRLLIIGKAAETEFPAAVFAPGVLFIRARKFYEMMRLVPEEAELTIETRPAGMRIGDVTFPWDAGDALLYADPLTAPARHPEESMKSSGPTPPGTLFEGQNR